MEILTVVLVAIGVFVIYKIFTTGFRDYTGEPGVEREIRNVYRQSQNTGLRRQMTPAGSKILYTFPPVPGFNDTPHDWSKYQEYITRLASNGEARRALREMIECNEAWGYQVISEEEILHMRYWIASNG